MDSFERIVAALSPAAGSRLAGSSGDVAAVNAAFLLELGGGGTATPVARELLEAPPAGPAESLAGLYRLALANIPDELNGALARSGDLHDALTRAAALPSPAADPEAVWDVFFPEGVGILGSEDERIEDLRRRRTIRIEQLNPRPLGDLAAELLLTSNVLLTVPSEGTDLAALPYDEPFRAAVRAAAEEEQLYWYDHPIQIGVQPAGNELLYGLRALDAALAFEHQRDRRLGPMRIVLSASVTHAGLRAIARDYVRLELAREGRLKHLAVHLFTEEDTLALIEDVLAPLIGEVGDDVRALHAAFGVDGEYGRHYTFLKAISALWQVAADTGLRATFKIDLDQVFPQEVLVTETGASALEHLRTPLWGALGRDAWDRRVELGMIAGALVNERDIGRGLFTPDVTFPPGPVKPDEHVFFSRLPQALSTRAEMMERYDGAERDGHRRVLERIHVTGGTNGILVDALRRHRPFTPAFIGRAEDQAYVLSVLDGEPRLAYAHRAGLIMRHDKEAFAGAAIEAARVGKLVGDDVRVLYFSAYADHLGRERIKELIDPFTGCFASRLPLTVVTLRLALRIEQAFADGDERLGEELAQVGARRLRQAVELVGDGNAFSRAVERERVAWDSYYAALDRLEQGLATGDRSAVDAARRAREIIGRTLLE